MTEQDVKLLEGPSTSVNRPLAIVAERVDRGPEPAAPDPSDPDSAPGPLLRIHELLRGRYVWAFALAVMLGALGTFAGYRVTTPKYRSTGLLRVRPVLPRVIFATEQNTVMPAYELFVNEQVALMTTPRVLDRVFDTPQWKQSGLHMSREEFIRGLSVGRQHERGPNSSSDRVKRERRAQILRSGFQRQFF